MEQRRMTTNEHSTIAERYAFWLAYYAASDWQQHAVRAAAAVVQR
jgi:hypothetical protein